MRLSVVVGVVGLGLALVGCSGGGQRSTRIACGSENYGHGTGYDAMARECLWQAYFNKQPAMFATTILTDEGDPIVKRVEVVSPDRINVNVDTTQDKFGEQKITTYTCSSMERRTMNRLGEEQVWFWLGNCRGGEAKELLI